MKSTRQGHIRHLATRLVAFVLAAVLLLTSFAAMAQNDSNVVRIGWYESPFNTTDELGRRSGYAYEYAQKVAVYTGWRYEYVEGSWSELMQMLAEGKIDLMTDVSYTQEREEKMLFSSFPMGAEDYYLFTTPDNKAISSEDYTTFNGKKIGANQGSVQVDYFKNWAQANGIEAELVELSGTEASNIAKLLSGEIDMYLTLEAIIDQYSAVPVCRIASSDFYFAVNKSRPDILQALNAAMNRIQDDNRFFNQQLYNKYLKSVSYNRTFNQSETEWLQQHGAIKVGYQDNYLAFCAKDPQTGELIGTLKDYLDTACESMQNGKLEFEPVAYPTAEAALEALKKGEVDCAFPVNLTDYYGEVKGYSITSSLMNTEMSAIVTESLQKPITEQDRVTVAVNAGNPNYEMFLLDYFPEWRTIYFKDTQECLRAISQGKADCLLISNFRYNNIAKYCKKYGLTSQPIGVKMDYCFAVKRDNAMLYSILNKINSAVPESTMSIALTRYTIVDSENSVLEYFRQNPGMAMALLIPVLLILLVLILRNAKVLKKAKENQQLISATETDDLTGLYTKSYFLEYANRMYIESPEKPMDSIVINIIQFHSVNAIKGRAFGDEVLCAIGEEIQAFTEFNGGIAGRAEGDRFALYTPHLGDYHTFFEQLQQKLNSLSSYTTIRLRMGIMPWQKDTEPQQLIEQALIACNMARSNYKENLVVYDENLHRREAYEQQLLGDLRRAIDQREFKVYYQPIFDIQTQPPRLLGAEALARWQHPTLGKVKPHDFISLFERNGQIGVLDNYIWREAVKQLAVWRKQYDLPLTLSINLSRLDFFDVSLEATLDNLLAENELTPDVLKLEVTESTYTENTDEFIAIVEKLRDKGYLINMDDFGAGYSSLNMLSTLPIDALKMDSAFVKNINDNEKRRQLVELNLGIAESLKVPVIAEGVENQEQLQLLKSIGCAQAQGYYFSKPLPAAGFEANVIAKEVTD